METIKLSFDSNILRVHKTLTVEVPYADSMVATSQFCPKELLSGEVDLLAALNGQPLEEFVNDCKNQLKAASATDEAKNLTDAHIAGLIAHYSLNRSLSLNDILLHVDVFSHLLYADGISEEEIQQMYPEIIKSIQSLIGH